jgi:torulene dioxygenase
VILCIWTFNIVAGGMRVLWEKNALDAICPFDSTQKVRWLVVDRRPGRGLVAEFESRQRFASIQSMHDSNPTHQEAKISSATSSNIQTSAFIHKFYCLNLMSSAQDITRPVPTKKGTPPAHASQDTHCATSNSTISQTAMLSFALILKPNS